MKINVTENKVSIKEEQILNENEYNIHKIQFDFSSEYTDDLVKVALFSIDNHTYKKIISNNECDIPPEVLTQRGYSILGVYAYKTEQDSLILRYSPSPTKISVYDGSYKAEAENSEPITPSEIEQYQQILQNSLQQFQNQYNVLVDETEGDIQAIEDELQRKVDEGYFDGEDGFSPIAKVIQKSNGATIEIEDKNGKTTADVLNGADGKDGENGQDGQDGQDGYTPQRGIDYWTEEDKEEIKEETIAEIDDKIEEYNTNHTEKMSTYNNNSTEKLNAFNENAVQKTEDFDAHTEEIQDNIEALQTENERLKATLPTTGEVTGQDITLNKTAELEFKKPPLPMGNSEQESTTGKNLLPSTNRTETINGVTFTKNSDGSITANGTATDGINYYTNGLTYTNIPAGTYKLSDSVNSGESGTTYFTFLDGSPDNNSTVNNPTFTLTENTDLRARIVIRSGQTLNNIVFKPMLRLASITDDTYEPYTNGASPNPDYPQEITNVTGDVEVKVQNKNIVKIDNVEQTTINGLTYFIQNGILTINGTANNGTSIILANNISLKQGTYTHSINDIKSGMYFSYDNINNTMLRVVSGTKITNITFQLSEDTIYSRYILWIDNNTSFNNEKYYLQTEENTTATPYTPHQEQTLPLTLGNIELCKIGDYQDYFYKESNKWYLHKEIGKVVLDGSESWTRENYSSQYYYRLSTTIPNQITGFSNYYKVIPYSTGILNYTNSLRINNSNIDIVNDKSNVSLEDFKSWLSTHNTEVYYVLQAPTDTEITDTTLISQLEAINNAISYEEQTNISSNTIALFNVEAYQDAKVILAEKGTYSKPSTGIPKSDLASAVQTSLNKADTSIQQHQDISGKQDKTDNNLTTINKTIVGAINEVDSIAKGANQALSYGNYSTMITAFNNLANDIYNIGQNIMIITLEVPDLWISGIESTSSTYTYVDDETFVNELKTNGYVQVGYYKLSALETQKVNLDDYVTKTENKNKADIINNELTGSTIYFTDGINNSPVNKLIVNIEPVQEGSGTPTPNNVRNIIGWNAAIINHSGADTQNPDTLNISWQNEAGIVYGGTLNVTTGLFTVTKALVELAVADMNNTEAYPGWKNTGIESIIGIGINQKFTSILNIGDTFSANTTSGTGTIFLPRSAYGLTQEQWKEQYPNLTIQIIAEYQNPETYQLTPHEIRTLLGINNFWANTGDVTVNYKADTKLYIDSKFQSLEDRLSLLEG